MNPSLALFALLILGSAGFALTRRNLIHSALLLIGAWFGIAGFYLWAGAEFVAFAQVLVYGGAVSMVVLFAVLLTRRSYTAESAAESKSALGSARSTLLVALAVFLLLYRAARGLDYVAPLRAPMLSVRQIGLRLMGGQAAALLALGLLLTVALIGAVVLAASPAEENRQDPP